MAPLSSPLRATAAAVLVSFALAPQALAQDVLVVVDDASSLIVSDDRIIGQLELLGLTPVVMSQNAATAGDATGKALVFVSSSVNSNIVLNTFQSVAVPAIIAEGFIWDDMGMTGSPGSGDLGTTTNETQFNIASAHPLATGLSGNVTISETTRDIVWGDPAASALEIATEVGDSSHVTLFAYESGAFMVSGTAPARRVGISLFDSVGVDWSADLMQLFSATVEWAMGDPITARTRIQPFGDSITQGILGFTSYRVPLFSLLTDDDCVFDFVGSRYEDHGASPFDANHQGRTSWRTDELEAALPGWLLGNRPDIVMIFAGTNDVLQGVPTNTIDQNLRDIIGLYRGAEPNVLILLAQIIPNLSGNDAAVIALNAAIAQIAIDLDSPASPIVLVDQYSTYDPVTMTSVDDIHPNAVGDAHIADVWAETLIPELGSTVCPGAATAVPVDGKGMRVLLALLVVVSAGVLTARRPEAV